MVLCNRDTNLVHIILRILYGGLKGVGALRLFERFSAAYALTLPKALLSKQSSKSHSLLIYYQASAVCMVMEPCG